MILENLTNRSLQDSQSPNIKKMQNNPTLKYPRTFSLEEIESLTEEEIYYHITSLNKFQCKSLYQNYFYNQTENNKFKLISCYMFNVFPKGSQKCIPESFIKSNDSISDEERKNFSKCILEDAALSSFRYKLRSVLKKPFSHFVERYKEDMQQRTKTGNIKNFEDAMNQNICVEESQRFFTCIEESAKRIGISEDAMHEAIEARTTDYCFMEKQKMAHCLVSNFCGVELHECMEKYKFHYPYVSNTIVFEKCLTGNAKEASNPVNECFSKIH